jgi:hypothetical protein
VLAGGAQAEFAHRIDDAPLHRLETVTDIRQGAVEDHVHRIIEIGLLGEGAQRQLLDRVELEARLHVV